MRLGDVVSIPAYMLGGNFLAILNETDPTPVKVIDYLKGELDKRKSKVNA